MPVGARRLDSEKLFPVEVRCGTATITLNADGTYYGDLMAWQNQLENLKDVTEPGYLALAWAISNAIRRQMRMPELIS